MYLNVKKGSTELVEFYLRNYKFRPILTSYESLFSNSMEYNRNHGKAIQTKQNGYKKLAEQTISTTEKCDLWQYGPGTGVLLAMIVTVMFKQ